MGGHTPNCPDNKHGDTCNCRACEVRKKHRKKVVMEVSA